MPCKKLKYTGVRVRSMVRTIEFVTTIDCHNVDETLERALDDLRTIGAAEVVGTEAISETFEAACTILQNRARNALERDE